MSRLGILTSRSCVFVTKVFILPSRAKVGKGKGSVRSRNQTTEDMGDDSSTMGHHALVSVGVSF